MVGYDDAGGQRIREDAARIHAMIPDEEQQRVIDTCVNDSSGGALIAGELGTGKTLIGTEIAKGREARRILVICPKNTRGYYRPWHEQEPYDGWEGTFRRQGWTDPIHRVEKREHMTDEDGIFIIGRQYVHAITKDRKKRTGEVIEAGVDWNKVKPFDIVIYDEVHGIMNRDSEAFKTALHIKADYFAGLSGTPSGNRFDGHWSVAKWLWRAWMKKYWNGYWAWRYEWCRLERFFAGAQGMKDKVIGEKEPGKWVAQLPNYHRLERTSKAEAIKMMVDLHPAQRKVYSQMENESIAFLENEKAMIADLPIVQRIRLREMTLGVPDIRYEEYIDKDGLPAIREVVSFDPNCKSAKMDALEEFLEDYEGKVIIATHSAKFAPAAAKRLGAELWYGPTPDEERAAIKERFIHGDSRLLVVTPRSFGTGTDGFQHAASCLVFLSRDDSGIENEQFIGRLDRRGQEAEKVQVIDLVAYDTYDEGTLSKEGREKFERMMSLRKEVV